jgi:glutathione S-transferase
MAVVAHMLMESNLPFRYERVSPYVGATISDEHTARNPLGKIPSLADSNGLLVSESQAICRYLARVYPEARKFYPCDDPVKCAAVDAQNDFITFSISGPFFSWFVFGAYFPKAWRLKTEEESRIFSLGSAFLIKDNLGRLIRGAAPDPFLLGSEPCLPDFQLFHLLELGKTFSRIFDMPRMDLLAGDEALQTFYDAVASRPSTQEILKAQASELSLTERELFEEFGKAYAGGMSQGRVVLEAMFGHPV